MWCSRHGERRSLSYGRSGDRARADVVGFPMGGAIAQELASTFLEKVRGLVRIATYDAALFREGSTMRCSFPGSTRRRNTSGWALRRKLSAGWLRTHCSRSQPLTSGRWPQLWRSGLGSGSPASVVPPCWCLGAKTCSHRCASRDRWWQASAHCRSVLVSGAGHGLLWARANEVFALIQAFLWSNPANVIR